MLKTISNKELIEKLLSESVWFTREDVMLSPKHSLDEWETNGEVIALTYEGEKLYPYYQFGYEGYLKPIVGEILGIMKPRMSDLEIIVWLHNRNSWLDGSKPKDVLTILRAEDILHAARIEVSDELHY